MLLEGPFESDYSLAIVNRRLALALLQLGQSTQLHQRDNTADYPPSAEFLAAWPQLASRFVSSVAESGAAIHSRCIYPPYTDRMAGTVRAFHSYAWEESAFPKEFVASFNRDLDLITVVSSYVREVLVQNGVKVPIEIVGNGADHILESQAEPVDCFEPERFHFVHISSCFPRKGADVLVEAFCREFRRGENVSLVIKTFANPHNEIERTIAKAFSRHRQHAPIRVIFDSWSQGQMRTLMELANCLVAPSRGEGFGLPVAESMLLGTPVIATIHGGHADLCSPQWCWPVDFRLEAAKTHLSEGRSYWAEPDRGSLQAAMREVYESNRSIIAQKTAAARHHVASRFTWAQVAQRHSDACARTLAEKRKPCIVTRSVASNFETRPGSPGHVGFITTWNARCGIAEYSRFLTTSLRSERRVSIFANRISDTVREDEPIVSRCWTAGSEDLPDREIDEMVRQICAAGCEMVSIQYNFGLLSPDTVDGLIRRLRRKGIAVAVTLHATANERYRRLITILQDAQAVIVHQADERHKLLSHGLTQVHLQRHGIYVAEHLQRVAPAGSDPNVFTVACFGFFLPPKGIYELLQAFSAASMVNPRLRLKLINSLYDVPESQTYAAECIRFIRSTGLGDRVVMSTSFLDQETIMRELADADLAVLPYANSTESASGAICLPLASLTPVLCSDIALFRKFAHVVHFFPAGDTVALANRLLELSTDTKLLRTFADAQRQYVDELAWGNVAREFEAIIDSCGVMVAETA